MLDNIPAKLRRLLVCRRCHKLKIHNLDSSRKNGLDTYCRDCKKLITKPEDRMICKARTLAWRLMVKCDTFDAYGGCFCAGCGEDELAVLSLDHIANNGAQERRDIASHLGLKTKKIFGNFFYRLLKRRNYPVGYRVLCMNCQWKAKSNITLPNDTTP